MSQAYTPGLKATRCVRHQSRRFLPISGDLLVTRGQPVNATEVVARTLLPGPVTPVSVARLLSVPAAELPRCMRKQIGDAVEAGELLARSPGIFGWFPVDCPAPTAGVVETISQVTGQVLLRGAPLAVELKAFLTGTVVETVPHEGAVIEAEVTLVQGIFGIGGEAYGPIRPVCPMPDDDLTAARLTADLRGAIVVGGARVTAEALSRAVELGVSAIVTGGIDDHDLRDFLGYDLGVATTGFEQVGLTLIITEGFGDIAMAASTFELVKSRAGVDAAVNGATQIRAGVVRPEVVIPWTGAERPAAEPVPRDSAYTPGLLQAGAAVRIIRDPWFGIIGSVGAVPSEPQVLASGSKARVVEVCLGTGERVVVPRANVELLEH
ncbi:MAG: hypothetical protein EXS05_05950 [Planctomycetaceae bacterium]|nr:hypothetical protein [Planctomycetaceae bacterium]